MTPPPPTIRVTHTPFCYSPTLGSPSPWDNHSFVYVGDVGARNQVTIINWSNNTFCLAPHIRVPTVATMGAQWTAVAGADCVGPFTVADADTEEKQACNVMVVPPEYVPIVMAHQSMTPQEMWNLLNPQVVADNQQVSCAPVIDWLLVACTYHQAASCTSPGHDHSGHAWYTTCAANS
jgi:hypothetical protein